MIPRARAAPLPASLPRLLVAAVTASLLGAIPARAAGVYYVDGSSASCTNSGAGTEAQPYCTISAAVAARGGSGTTILVKPGVYREQISVSASGGSGSPFVIRALGAVTIDGADDFSTTASWALATGSVYRAASVTWNPVQVIVDNARLVKTTLSSGQSPGTIPVNGFAWVSGQGLYVNLGGANPGTRQTKVGRRAYGFSMYARSHVTIEGFTVLRSEERGINLGDACTNVSLLRNQVSYNAKQGVYVNGGSGFLFGSNVVTDNADHGIYAVTGVTGSTFEDNECARNAHPTVRSANGIYLYGAPNNVFRRNRLHHNQDSGLQIQSGSNGNICYLNRSWSNGDHGYDHLFATNTIHVGDVAYGNYKDGFSIEGNATGTQVHNSIAVDNGLTSNEFDLWVDSGSTQGFVSNYNIFWNSTAQAPFKYVSTTYASIANYRAASGQDAQSIQANPRFVDAPGGDFHLLAGSPAIDSGNSGVAHWQALDADGLGRVDDPATANTGVGPIAFGDRGPFEFVPTVTSNPPVVNAPASASGTENAPLTVNVTASDPDGDPITSLTATGLPAGATFTAGPGNTSGQLNWTPSFAQAGIHAVTFRATNAQTGTATTTITIANVDRRPVVTAPAALSVRPGFPLIIQVTASDPDGEAITSFTVSPLPAGATFTPNANKTSATFHWVPSLAQVGSYNLTFTAGNAMTGTASTAVTVSTTADQNPVVTAPATATVRANANLTFQVTATDPDGNAIQSLTAAPLPAGATFTPAPGNNSGTFSWTPTPAQEGVHSVTFTASNLLVGWATTSITVRPANQPPTAVLNVTPSTGNAPLSVVASAAGSSDSDGGIVSYLFHWGDGTSTGPQAGNAASHVYGGGTWICSVTVTDVDNGTTTVSQTVIVAPAAAGTNFVANPSFETNASGWVVFGTATLQRVAGGFDGGWALQVSTTRNQSFGADDSPNTVASTGPAGTRYRCQAWVRSVAGTGEVRLRVREFRGADRVGQASSAGVILSPTWQLVTLDYLAVGSGNSLDINVIDQPHGSNLPFLLDNVSVRIATGPGPAVTQGGGSTNDLESEVMEAPAGPPLRAVLAPSPLESRSTLVFRTTQPGPLSVVVYDLSGRRVRRLVEDPWAAAGAHRIPVDGYGDSGTKLGAGVYFYRVRGVEGEAVGRFVIAR